MCQYQQLSARLLSPIVFYFNCHAEAVKPHFSAQPTAYARSRWVSQFEIKRNLCERSRSLWTRFVLGRIIIRSLYRRIYVYLFHTLPRWRVSHRSSLKFSSYSSFAGFMSLLIAYCNNRNTRSINHRYSVQTLRFRFFEQTISYFNFGRTWSFSTE